MGNLTESNYRIYVCPMVGIMFFVQPIIRFSMMVMKGSEPKQLVLIPARIVCLFLLCILQKNVLLTLILSVGMIIKNTKNPYPWSVTWIVQRKSWSSMTNDISSNVFSKASNPPASTSIKLGLKNWRGL
jgi:hypothetical protein